MCNQSYCCQSGSADIGDNRGRRISGGRRPSAGRRPASNTVSPSPAPLNNNISRNAASPRPRNLTNTNPFETESSPGSPTSPTRYWRLDKRTLQSAKYEIYMRKIFLASLQRKKLRVIKLYENIWIEFLSVANHFIVKSCMRGRVSIAD